MKYFHIPLNLVLSNRKKLSIPNFRLTIILVLFVLTFSFHCLQYKLKALSAFCKPFADSEINRT